MTKMTFPDDSSLYANLPDIPLNNAEKYGALSDLRTEIVESVKRNLPSCNRRGELKAKVMRDVKHKYGDILTVILLFRIAWSVYALCRWIWEHHYGR